MDAAAKEAGSIINAVLLGAMAASNKLPLKAESLKATIRESDKAVDANIRGFEAGLKGSRAASTTTQRRPRLRVVPVDELIKRVRETFPAAVHEFIIEGVTRLADYQNLNYAKLYLDRLDVIRDLDGDDYQLTNEAARYLALWMAYQDLIRVAQQKSHRDRFERVRAEVRAKADEPIIIVDYLKPGIEELCSVLPTWLAVPILKFAHHRGRTFSLAMHIQSNTIWGFVQLILLTKLRPFRPHTYRFKEENQRIEQWLSYVCAAVERDQRLRRYLPARLDRL